MNARGWVVGWVKVGMVCGVLWAGWSGVVMGLPSAAAQVPGQGSATFPPATNFAAGIDDLSAFTPEEQTAIRVYDRVNRSVVNISTKSLPRDAFLVFDQAIEGAGSGAVLDLQGHILTNHHVVDGSNEVRVTLYNGESYPARIVGSDPPNDIAVLKIDAPETSLIPVAAGESNRLRVGQRIYAIGNPFGLERTMTEGIISSLNRTLPVRGTERTMKSIIQIDAALNRGNSGGPLLDTRGEMVGMNTAIASSIGENSGVGFSIPISTIRRVVPQLIEQGRVIRADLGIERTWSAPEGLGIAIMVPKGAAEAAGLRGVRVVVQQRRQGPFVYQTPMLDFDYADRILAVAGQRVANIDELLTVVESHRPGDTIEVTVLREGEVLSVPITLGEER